MMPIREYMKDSRVAAAVVAVALFAVGYRTFQARVVSRAPSDPVVEAPPPAPAPADPAALRALRPIPLPPSSIPAGWSGPEWNWERNPFLPPSVEDARGTAGAADAYVADRSVPGLRGTVAGAGGGSAIFRGDRPDGGDVLVPAGGTIGGWTLAAVEPYRVFLRRGKETRIVELYRQ
jgi:hypothetical protein